MARGTDFGGVHSFRDLHLIQQAVELSPAEPKTNLVDVPGADGSKDLSELPAGRVTYKDRKVSWTFALYPGDSWDEKHRQVSNALNGRACHITLDTLPGYYLDGRLAVKKYKTDGLLKQITVEATCRPYLLKQDETRIRAELTTDPTRIILMNSRRRVVPTIELTAETILSFCGQTIVRNAGTHKILSLELVEGENVLDASVKEGTGEITVTYQEGDL